MEEANQEQKEVSEKWIWKMSYSWVLIINAVYILLFYLLMKSYA